MKHRVAFTTVQACKEECAKTEGCVAFMTAAGTNNQCWLKDKNYGAESANAIFISARMSCYKLYKGEYLFTYMFQIIFKFDTIFHFIF